MNSRLFLLFSLSFILTIDRENSPAILGISLVEIDNVLQRCHQRLNPCLDLRIIEIKSWFHEPHNKMIMKRWKGQRGHSTTKRTEFCPFLPPPPSWTVSMPWVWTKTDIFNPPAPYFFHVVIECPQRTAFMKWDYLWINKDWSEMNRTMHTDCPIHFRAVFILKLCP